MVIPGSTPESVEGLVYSWVVYRMKATIGRGAFGRDILANKHVRIVRTLDPTALDLSHAMVRTVKSEVDGRTNGAPLRYHTKSLSLGLPSASKTPLTPRGVLSDVSTVNR